MSRYIALLRGINISGKNKIPMAELKEALKNSVRQKSALISTAEMSYFPLLRRTRLLLQIKSGR